MSEFSVRYSSQALEDLSVVWDDVYEASREYDIADRYADELMAKIAGKKAFPLSGSPLLHEDLFTGYYYENYKAHKAFYRVKDEGRDH